MTRTAKEFVALLACLGAALCASMSTLLLKVAVKEVPPVSLGCLRYLVGTGCLLACGMAMGRAKVMRLSARDLPSLAFVGLMTFCLTTVGLAYALTKSPVARVSILFATTPLWSLGLGILLRAEPISLRKLLGAAATLAGVIVLVWPSNGDLAVSGDLVADAVVLAAAFGMALGGFLQKRALTRYAPFTVAVYRMASAAVLLLPAAIATDWDYLTATARALTSSTITAIVLLGTLGGALMSLLWSYSFSKLSPTQVLMFMNLQPVITAGVAVFAFGEHPTVRLVLGGAAVLGGIGVALAAPRLTVIAVPSQRLP
ncbi:MAG: DMT family transporter [Myxococcota bacterium]